MNNNLLQIQIFYEIIKLFFYELLNRKKEKEYKIYIKRALIEQKILQLLKYEFFFLNEKELLEET